MSVENLKEYARRCASEPALLEAAREFGMDNMEEHMEAAERLGLDWDMDDMAAYAKELVDSDAIDDMTGEELEQISGGNMPAAGAAAGVGAAVAGTASAGGNNPSSSGW